MGSLRFKRFSKPLLLMSVEKGLLREFFGRFERELAADGVRLPASDLPDEAFSHELARLLMSPDELPDALNEALYAIDEMGNPDGRERLQEAMQASKPAPAFRADSTDLDFAIQAWLQCPGVFACKHAEFQMQRLCSFDYFGAATPGAGGPAFTSPDETALRQLTHAVDTWHERHLRGTGTTQIDVHAMDGEHWFIIRHGDSYVRVPATEQQQRKVIQYRPERDDVVVYSPATDEIRVHAKLTGERQLYREAFGFYLFGDRNRFSQAMTYTLAPLVEQREGLLDTGGVKGVREIVLTEVDVQLSKKHDAVRIHKADNLFTFAAAELFPTGCLVRRAAFDFFFGLESKPRTVHVCPPNRLKLARRCDGRPVHRWLSLRGIKSRHNR